MAYGPAVPNTLTNWERRRKWLGPMGFDWVWKNVPAAALAAGFFVWASTSLASEADTSSEPLDQIVVVAHKDERSIRDVAANVTVIDRSTLGDQLATSLADAFRYVPGVDYEAAGTRFGTEGISIRGIGGNRVAVLIDGIPLSDQFDVGSFSNATRDLLDSGLIEGIEVLHGPASALYGSEALGGVIAVRTPDPSDMGSAVRMTWQGADDSRHVAALTTLSTERSGLVLGGSLRNGGERDAAAAPSAIDTRDDERRAGLVKAVVDDRSGNTWRASVILQDAHTYSDLNSMLGSGRFRSTTALQGDDRYRTTSVSVSWEFTSAWFDAGVVQAFHQDAETEQSTLDERGNAPTPVSIDRFFAFEQASTGLDLNLWKDVQVGETAHRLGFGVEIRDRHTEEYRDGLSTDFATGATTNVLLGEVFPLRDFPISDTREFAVYLEDTLSLGKWSLVAALRADHYELEPSVDPIYLADYPFANPVAIEESEVSPKLGVIFQASPGIDIYAQYSHGFRAPPYAEANVSLEVPLFNFRAIPNPDLRSESSDGIDVGLRWRGQRSSAWMSLFHTRYEDFIESKARVGTDPVSGRILFQSRNLNETVIEGLEAGWSARFGAWSTEASAYIARGENRDNGEPLNSVGPAQAVLGLGWHSVDERLSLRLKTTLTERWDDRDETGGELFVPAGYAIVDLFVMRRLGERSTLRAGIYNLADRTVWHWSEVRGVAPDDPVLPYLSLAGRSASVSFDVNW